LEQPKLPEAQLEAIRKRLEELSRLGENNCQTSNHVAEVGLQKRAIYNSIIYTLRDREMKAIKGTGSKAAIVQAFNLRNPRPEGMISVLKGDTEMGGLIEETYKAGIEKSLIFMPVLDVPSIGSGAQGIYLAKQEFG